jgi:hypothetical protein
VNCADLRSAAALLHWLQAAALCVGATSCSWSSATDWTVVEAAPPEPPKRKDVSARRFEPDRCLRVCTEDEEVRCYEASLVVPSDSPRAEGTRDLAVQHPASAATTRDVVVCQYHRPGSFEYFSIVPTPFGRVARAHSAAQHAALTEAEHFFDCARSEAQSITEFQQLALDLEALGAPVQLIAASRRAARDEARHARWALHAAQRRGLPRTTALPRLVRPTRRAPNLFQLAVENASAGCAAETFGVWLHLVQARRAYDPEVRANAERIARDEARHAALAFELEAWFGAQLSSQERQRVRDAMLEHWRRMPHSELVTESLRGALGIPTQSQLQDVALALEDTLRRA